MIILHHLMHGIARTQITHDCNVLMVSCARWSGSGTKILPKVAIPIYVIMIYPAICVERVSFFSYEILDKLSTDTQPLLHDSV